MTPEELNRKMEFIVEMQAKTSVALDIFHAENAEFAKWAKNAVRQLAISNQGITELIAIQSSRLDRSEQLLAASKQRLAASEQRIGLVEQESRAAQERHEQLLSEMRASCDRVLD